MRFVGPNTFPRMAVSGGWFLGFARNSAGFLDLMTERLAELISAGDVVLPTISANAVKVGTTFDFASSAGVASTITTGRWNSGRIHLKRERMERENRARRSVK